MASIGVIIDGKNVEFANNGRKSVTNVGGDVILDYEQAINKPSINGVTLQGNKTLGDIGVSHANVDIDFSTYFS